MSADIQHDREAIERPSRMTCYAAVRSLPQDRVKMSRVFAFPDSETFNITPIRGLVKFYLSRSKISIDPFARNKRWATYTNDLNPETAAQYHMDSSDYLEMLVAEDIQADLVLFDPPYSPRQIKECYDGIGLKMKQEDAWRTNGWKRERKAIAQLVRPDGFVISFGWHSNGIGRYHGFEIEEIMQVCHGWGHNDTICMVEKKVETLQGGLFTEAA